MLLDVIRRPHQQFMPSLLVSHTRYTYYYSTTTIFYNWVNSINLLLTQHNLPAHAQTDGERFYIKNRSLFRSLFSSTHDDFLLLLLSMSLKLNDTLLPLPVVAAAAVSMRLWTCVCAYKYLVIISNLFTHFKHYLIACYMWRLYLHWI